MERLGKRRYVLVLAFVVLLLGALVGGAIALRGTPVLAQGSGDDEGETEDGDLEDAREGEDAPITGPALERAGAVALKYAGGGRITGTEVGDEDGYYEIEVTLPNGRQVDVHLDAAFNILGSEGD